ncbi:hypothetical protein RQP46_002756 [Phenoliferia psychrophenolica]
MLFSSTLFSLLSLVSLSMAVRVTPTAAEHHHETAKFMIHLEHDPSTLHLHKRSIPSAVIHSSERRIRKRRVHPHAVRDAARTIALNAGREGTGVWRLD